MRLPALSTLILASLLSSPAAANEKALPLGIDLGTSTCSEILASTGAEWKLTNMGQSVWSNGAILKSPDPRLPGLGFASELLIICDEQDRSIHVSMTIPKNNVQQIAQSLDTKYRSTQRNLPHLGNGLAKWTASNASISLEYQHVSFTASLSYETAEARQMWAAYTKREAERKETETASQL